MPKHLSRSSTRTEIRKAAAPFDSLYVFDVASYWEDDLIVMGFSFTNGTVTPTRFVHSHDAHTGEVHLDTVLREAPYSRGTYAKLKDLHLARMCAFSEDSLSFTAWPLASDQEDWALAIIYAAPNKDCVKRVYALHELHYTEQQRQLMHFFEALRALKP